MSALRTCHFDPRTDALSPVPRRYVLSTERLTDCSEDPHPLVLKPHDGPRRRASLAGFMLTISGLMPQRLADCCEDPHPLILKPNSTMGLGAAPVCLNSSSQSPD